MFENHEKDLKALVLRLFKINAFKFGDFKMKVGINSPVYFDLRVIIAYPDVMKQLADLLQKFMRQNKLPCDHLCGVPYTALPIATLLAVKDNKSMIIRRKEPKPYGTKKMIEGSYKPGDLCLIIEDIVTSGSSILETVRDLRNEGLKVTDAVVVVDREQGGANNLTENGVKMHSLFTLSYLLNTLKEAGNLEQHTVDSVANYIRSCQIRADGTCVTDASKVVNDFLRTKMSFSDRADLAKCPIAKELFNLMSEKKTNLCLAADLEDPDEILAAAKAAGPYICVLKTHCDFIRNFNQIFTGKLVELAKKYNFLIMEDRKFADIGSIASMQYSEGAFNIVEWAELVTVHAIGGQGTIQGLKSVLNGKKNRGTFLVAEMSTQKNFTTKAFQDLTMELATDSSHIDFIAGIVCQSVECFTFPGLIQLTPGCKIDETSDGLGQNYNTPEFIVKEKGGDVVVVGRGILEAESIEQAAILYRDRLWAAYCDRIDSKQQ